MIEGDVVERGGVDARSRIRDPLVRRGDTSMRRVLQVPGSTLAQRLHYLFYIRHHPAGGAYTIREVAAASEGIVARTTLYSMLNGSNTNPSRETVLWLARFFQVPIAYLFPELDREDTLPIPGWRD